MRLYLDTSIIGAGFDREPRGRPAETERLFEEIRREHHEGLISNVVLEEIREAPPRIQRHLEKLTVELPLRILVEDVAVTHLADEYEKAKIVRTVARVDLRHLAVATVNAVDALVSWNFRDIVNIRTRRGMQVVNARLGYGMIEIVSPLEVIEHG